jgi:hypothetical protein
MIRRPIDKAAARELAERAGLVVLDPSDDAVKTLVLSGYLDGYDAGDLVEWLVSETARRVTKR